MPSDFEKLPTIERRLVGKFISTLSNSKLDAQARRKIVRTLRRAARCSEDCGGGRKNAYTYFYCERFAAVKQAQLAKGLATTVCELAKVIATEWKGLDAEKKSHYTQLAKASRVSSAVAV